MDIHCWEEGMVFRFLFQNLLMDNCTATIIYQS